MGSGAFEGQMLGRYRILEPLGRGGMALVYRAYHAQLDRYVAIKLLRFDLADEAAFLTRFRREARAIANLRHPHIVQVYDFDVEDDLTYMVMEFLEGDTLKARLDDYRRRDRRMPLGEIVRIMLDVLDGLAYAHSEGVVHRDLKPSNILLTKRGQAVISDFGIAHMAGGTKVTATGALMGTPEYMAPEQGLQGQSDVRSDIYAMGVILFELLTRRIPFEAKTPVATLLKHIQAPPSPPREIDGEIPTSLERVVLRALAKAPEERYPDAIAMAEALNGAATEAGIGIPDRIPLAVSFRTQEAPLESVEVISNAAGRERIDAGVAGAETDPTLQPLSPHAGLRAPQGSPLSATSSDRDAVPHRVAKGIFMAIGIVSLGNLFGLTISSVLDNWVIFERGWPMELLLIGGALFMLMAVTRTIWLSIPAAVITANGFLFTYSTFTGNWHHWAYLWIVEVWIVSATVIVSSLLAQQPHSARKISRILGWTSGTAVLIASIAVQSAALAADLVSRLTS
jgi:serine/threonine protein kinase